MELYTLLLMEKQLHTPLLMDNHVVFLINICLHINTDIYVSIMSDRFLNVGLLSLSFVS